MSREMDENLVPIESTDQLVDYFRGGEKPASERGVGTEHEKFVFRRSDYGMVSYEETGGIGDLLQTLADDHGWKPSFDRQKIVALGKDQSAVTLEPGGQIELSGAITKNIFET
ncbi:MAG: glutamate--cysteine ligase, partial [Persicimonas sp.]